MAEEFNAIMKVSPSDVPRLVGERLPHRDTTRILHPPQDPSAIPGPFTHTMILQPHQEPSPTPGSFTHPSILQPHQTSKPKSLKRLNHTITVPISIPSTTRKEFRARVNMKAKSDACLSLGSDLPPQTPTAGDIEPARGFFQDLPENFHSYRLNNYGNILTGYKYSDRDLLPTTVMGEAAEVIHKQCHILYNARFRDAHSIMRSVAALALSLGKALHEPNAETKAEVPVISNRYSPDFQVFGTRCLYLVWCADWLSEYLAEPVGENILIANPESAKSDLEAARTSAVYAAGLLLRNWVAWRMFTEEVTLQGWFHGGDMTENETM